MHLIYQASCNDLDEILNHKELNLQNYGIFRGTLKEQHPKVLLAKNSIPRQIVFEILAQLCSDDSIQNPSKFEITLGTESED